MARVKTFTNGGSLLPGDLNSIEDDYEYAFSTYKTIITARDSVAGLGLAAGTWVITNAGGGVQVVPIAYFGAGFYFDPADWTANTRANKLRIRAQVVVNAVAPTTTWTFGLYPIATTSGGSGVAPLIATLGAVTAGSTVAFAAPGATSSSQANSGDFAAPAAGFYCLAVVNSGAAAANSSLIVRAELQARQV